MFSINKYKLKIFKWNFFRKFSWNLIVKTELFKIKISSKDDGIGKEFYFSGHYSLAEIDKAIGVLKHYNIYKMGALLDIGANIGHVTLHCLAKKYSNFAICIEPDEFNFKLLKDNIKINNFEDITALKKIALGSKSGKEKIILSENNYGDHRIFTPNETIDIDKYNPETNRKIEEIDITTMDDLQKTNTKFNDVSFISIDVQGFELEILKGGINFFKQGIPMMLEIDPYLLEKKGSELNVLNEVLTKCFTHFVDIHSENIVIKELSYFITFYDELKKSNKDYSDLLFFKLN